ncbi:MAG: transporter substrate-binding domain-containing protein [Rhodocyclaceae bacterium]|nr:transporter substrate-binding domain-containing protein [Rhodocyclaceae bacterium]MCB1963939.1 transporter substrate-binding domain-containing protein [Rhodocyclaceae bacterium]
MKNNRLQTLLMAVGILAATLTHAATAEGLATQQEGLLRVAVYKDFPPYADAGKGVDVALGRELARRLGLDAEIVAYAADEDMNDDLRNMVWKGHYLGTRPADVMLHVPVDERLAERNEQVKIFGPYHLESLAIARDPARVGPVTGSAARALEVFTREKVGVETESLADGFLLSVLHGRLRENVVHFTTVADAVAAMQRGDVAAVMATQAEIEAALGQQTRFSVGPVDMPELRIKGWPLGMAIKRDNTQLGEALTAAMIEIQRDGTLDRIFAEHGITRRTP